MARVLFEKNQQKFNPRTFTSTYGKYSILF